MAAEQHVDKTTIEFAAKLDASLANASKAATNALEKVQKSAEQASKSLKSISSGVAGGISKGVEGIGSNILKWSIGLTAAAAGFSSLKGFIDAAMEASSAEKTAAITRKLTTSLANIPWLARQGAGALREQEHAITATARKMEDLSGINESIYRNAFTTLTTFGATKREVNEIATAMADYLASTTGAKTTMADAEELAQKIAVAAVSGSTRAFRMLGARKDELKVFTKLTSAAERLDYIEALLERRAKGQAKSLGDSPIGAWLKAENEKERAMATYGDVFKSIKRGWDIVVDHLLTHALPLGFPALKTFEKDVLQAFRKVEKTIDGVIKQLSTPEMMTFWSKWGQDLKACADQLFKMDVSTTGISASIKHLADQLDVVFKALIPIDKAVRNISQGFSDAEDVVAGWGRAVRGALSGLSAPSSVSIIQSDQAVIEARRRLDQARAIGSPMDINKALQEWRDAVEAQKKATQGQEILTNKTDGVSQAFDTLSRVTNGLIGSMMYPSGPVGRNYGLHGGLSNVPGAVYEQYEDEGHAARTGAYKNWRLHGSDIDTEIGLGPEYRAQRGIKLGDWVRSPSHPELGLRQVRESSERGQGVEFATRRSQQGRYSKLGKILDIEKAKPPGASASPSSGHTIHYSPTIHIGRLDRAALAELHTKLIDHSRELIDHLQRASAEDYRTSFA